MNFRRVFSRTKTAQTAPIPGASQVVNSNGGYVWEVDDWTRLRRFLILGTEGGSYYASERKLTIDNAASVERCVRSDGARAVAEIVAISSAGRAPKNDPAIFALAMAAKLGDFETRRAAHAAVPLVCRTGTHVQHFVSFVELFGGWGRGTRSAIQRWFNDRSASQLAYQVVKYQSRDGWSMRDLLRLAHPKTESAAHAALYRWIVKGELGADDDISVEVADQLSLVGAFEAAKRAAHPAQIVKLIEQYHLPREAVPTQFLVDAQVWEALLARMPMGAMVRNLATMTRVGLLSTFSAATKLVTSRLADSERLRVARLHPIAVLAAQLTYASGHSVRGDSNKAWKSVTAIVDALDAAFYAAFGNVEASGERTLLALDVSGSMAGGTLAGVPGLSPRVASAAMALVTAATEKQHAFVAFSNGLTELEISPRWRTDQVVNYVSHLPFCGTDCAQPMLWALAKRMPVDRFVIYTDSETWSGDVHPIQALREYRQKMGIAAKLIVVGMLSNGFSIADPNDAGMLDVVGFDTATPSVISSFGSN